jgi:hypothetical protein
MLELRRLERVGVNSLPGPVDVSSYFCRLLRGIPGRANPRRRGGQPPLNNDSTFQSLLGLSVMMRVPRRLIKIRGWAFLES